MMPIPTRTPPGMPPEVPGVTGGATVVVVTIPARLSVVELWDRVVTAGPV